MRFSAAVVALAASVSALPKSSPNHSGPSYQEMAVLHHNIHRWNHSAPAISWDTALAEAAQKKANSCVYAFDGHTDCPASLGHSCGANRGLGGGTPTTEADHPNWIAQVITDQWYNGAINSLPSNMGTSQTNPDFSHLGVWGELSQIVWKNSTKLGCATNDCSNTDLQGTFTICLYSYPGNYGFSYYDNVSPGQGWPTIYYSYGEWRSHKY